MCTFELPNYHNYSNQCKLREFQKFPNFIGRFLMFSSFLKLPGLFLPLSLSLSLFMLPPSWIYRLRYVYIYIHIYTHVICTEHVQTS